MTGGSYDKISAGNLRPDAHRQRAGIVSCIGSPDSSLTAFGSVRQQRAQHGAGHARSATSKCFHIECRMSAKGHKRTITLESMCDAKGNVRSGSEADSAVHEPMSALPPISE